MANTFSKWVKDYQTELDSIRVEVEEQLKGLKVTGLSNKDGSYEYKVTDGTTTANYTIKLTAVEGKSTVTSIDVA
ncbi:hypothetical protein SCLARK_00906 [Spiroplasma clarkii]|uniref:hypothetical protein n=1 Tax=Spiroplasma clarkii TaxID=2139 RepID=UPI000B56A13D|nr:hypothetical protein [Spiroplasma clarkii]ARU91515.1 hypothetical protein SCLARK_00906 [Spiroplasma clarkii]